MKKQKQKLSQPCYWHLPAHAPVQNCGRLRSIWLPKTHQGKARNEGVGTHERRKVRSGQGGKLKDVSVSKYRRSLIDVKATLPFEFLV